MKSPLFPLCVLLFVTFLTASRAEDFKQSESGLKYRTVRTGTGPVAQVGQIAVVHEIMKKEDGTIMSDTYAYNVTPQFEIGGNQAIKGIDEGVVGMHVGEIREFIVPPSLSQRKVYPPNLSPTEVLHYEIFLVRLIEKKPPPASDRSVSP